MGGADVPAAGQRGEPADVHAHEPGKDLGLHIAKHREPGSELLDGAVPLAQLNTGKGGRERRLGFDGGCGGNEIIAAQGLGQRFGAVCNVRSGFVDLRRVAALHVSEALDGEGPHGVRARHFLELLEGKCGDIEVVVAQARLTLRAEDITACGTACPCAGPGHTLDFDHTGTGQMVQVPPHGRRREAQQVPELGGADRSVLQDGGQDPVPGALIGVSHRTGGRPATVCGSLGGSLPGKGHSSSIAHGIHNTMLS